jgi:hypothetical protein
MPGLVGGAPYHAAVTSQLGELLRTTAVSKCISALEKLEEVRYYPAQRLPDRVPGVFLRMDDMIEWKTYWYSADRATIRRTVTITFHVEEQELGE